MASSLRDAFWLGNALRHFNAAHTFRVYYIISHTQRLCCYIIYGPVCLSAFPFIQFQLEQQRSDTKGDN